jgi:hypothetical protein
MFQARSIIITIEYPFRWHSMYNREAPWSVPRGFFRGPEASLRRIVQSSNRCQATSRGEEVSPFGGNVNPMIQVLLGDKADIWERPVQLI